MHGQPKISIHEGKPSCQLTGEIHLPTNPIWAKLWKLKVPGAVKNFLWRACRNCLPTTTLLQERGFRLSLSCPFCQVADESVEHCLVQCEFASLCWKQAALGYVPSSCTSFAIWFGEVMNINSAEVSAIFAMVSWKLWQNRNKLVWNGKKDSVQAVLDMAGNLLIQWQRAQTQPACDVDLAPFDCDGNVIWSKLPFGWTKVNIDAATFSNNSSTGVGCILRDHNGQFVAAVQKKIAGHFPPKEAEAIGLRAILTWLKQKHLDHLIVDLDAKSVVDAVRNPPAISVFDLLIEDCKSLISCFSNLQLRFVFRSANVVAHLLARGTSPLTDLNEWLTQPPPLTVHAFVL